MGKNRIKERMREQIIREMVAERENDPHAIMAQLENTELSIINNRLLEENKRMRQKLKEYRKQIDKYEKGYEKKLVRGKWYECIDGNMPEDIIELRQDKEYPVDIEVISVVVLAFIGFKGFRFQYEVRRVRTKGSEWEWDKNSINGRPIYWMSLPPIPSSSEY